MEDRKVVDGRASQTGSTIWHELFGTVVWNDLLKLYVANVPKDDEHINVHLDADANNVHSILQHACILFNSLSAHDASAKKFAAEELLELKNSTWLDEDEHPLASEVFQSKMRLCTISFSTDYSSNWFYDDGDLFWGHTILLTTDGTGQFRSAAIAG